LINYINSYIIPEKQESFKEFFLSKYENERLIENKG